MRVLFFLCLTAALAGGQSATPAVAPPTGAAASSADATPKRAEGPRARAPGKLTTDIPGLARVASRIYPLMNAEIVDSQGVRSTVVAFHRISGENRFNGFLGAAEVEIPYKLVSEIRVSAAAAPGGRMRARFVLESGKVVPAVFDEREGEQLFAGYTVFGRLTVFWRDLRHVKFTGRTKTTDLPRYGKATGGVDVRLTDREGVSTELVRFRRATGDNYVDGLRGASRVQVPLRIVKKATMRRSARSPLLVCELELKDIDPVRLRFPRYAEDAIYRGHAEFGDLRIRLGEIRELIVRRSSPQLRDLDPVAAAEGKEVEIGKSKPR
ncbi:MAG: hypothetical protein ACYTGZ_18540 [Planctomycetota bacterium]|jgi:hypothetical protein